MEPLFLASIRKVLTNIDLMDAAHRAAAVGKDLNSPDPSGLFTAAPSLPVIGADVRSRRSRRADVVRHSAVEFTRMGSRSIPLSMGGWSSASIRSDGGLWAWGLNWEGQLGVGDQENHMDPTSVGCGIPMSVQDHGAALLSAYPNPTEGSVRLDRKVDEPRVHDLHGRLLIVQRSTARVELSSLPAGIYVLEARDPGLVARIPVVKH